eukprot:TRINITY_DN749_c0_g1_i1.p1 TRINITY_DN749_c0_g1~~TRINITY_DN749_c0_g1_i1.p1  ORF type:complete len:543 (-),score=79.91 TRINITY_DN749_c0_g1_i1:20-1594(-)
MNGDNHFTNHAGLPAAEPEHDDDNASMDSDPQDVEDHHHQYDPEAPVVPGEGAFAPVPVPSGADEGKRQLQGLPAELLSELQPIFDALDRRPMVVRDGGRDDLVEYSIFTPALEGRDATELVARCVAASATADRAVGSMVGMSLGDALGHPLEFITADDSLPPYRRDRPHCDEEKLTESGEPKYYNEMNAFRLHPGQWTDDNSMGLCLADSLIVTRGVYNGSDCRTRWYNWWNGGYNNAFRFDRKRYSRSSCGLGGNIAKSMYSMRAGRPVTPFFDAGGADAGNGCIMRLAPAALAFHLDPVQAEKAAADQCRGTHPGPDAIAASRFMAYFIARAIHAPAGETSKAFLDRVVEEYLQRYFPAPPQQQHPHPNYPTDSGMLRLRNLLLAREAPDSLECNWNWREDRLAIREAIKNRQRTGNGYNGYPVSPGYFGAYSMDGLAMAMWAFYHSDSFHGALLRTVNLLGDADSTGSVAGQMAGAFYGHAAIQSSEFGRAWTKHLHQWDKFGETPLRGLLLHCLAFKGS